MSTTLSTQNSESLRQLSSFDDDTIKKIAEATFKSFTDPQYQSPDLKENEAKAQIGLATLISLYVRQGTFADSLSAVLKDNGLSQTSVQIITDLYKDNVDLMRANLSNVAFTYPRIIGCQWRHDYSVKNSETGAVFLPCFFIELKLEGGDSINFACNEEEMTALVAALKDASQEAARTH